jgi:hypothetical protein
VCREAQDEESKTTSLLSEATSADIKTSSLLSSSSSSTAMGDSTSNENVIVENYLDEPSTSSFDIRLLNSTAAASSTEMKAEPSESSPRAKRHHPLDLSPENFFMTSNEINGTFLIFSHSLSLFLSCR